MEKVARSPRGLQSVSVGASGVWAVGKKSAVYVRLGIDARNPGGRQWKKVVGKLVQVDSGPLGSVCGVSVTDAIFCKIGSDPIRSKWTWIRGRLRVRQINIFNWLQRGVTVRSAHHFCS